MDLFYVLDLFTTGFFGMAGGLVAHRVKLNFFSSFVLAGVTGTGGGTLRDLLLQTQPFWIADNNFLWAIAIAILITHLWIRLGSIPQNAFLIIDTVALGFATMLGTEKAMAYGMSPMVSVLMGIMTGVCGGMIRDTLANQTPMVFKNQELYASASLISAVTTVFVPMRGAESGLVGAGLGLSLLIRLQLVRILPLLLRFLPVGTTSLFRWFDLRYKTRRRSMSNASPPQDSLDEDAPLPPQT
jgi:uncharacterized membrane protein YeiH